MHSRYAHMSSSHMQGYHNKYLHTYMHTMQYRMVLLRIHACTHIVISQRRTPQINPWMHTCMPCTLSYHYYVFMHALSHIIMHALSHIIMHTNMPSSHRQAPPPPPPINTCMHTLHNILIDICYLYFSYLLIFSIIVNPRRTHKHIKKII